MIIELVKLFAVIVVGGFILWLCFRPDVPREKFVVNNKNPDGPPPEPPKPESKFSKELKQLMKESGTSAHDLAVEHEVAVSTVERWLDGRSVPGPAVQARIVNSIRRKMIRDVGKNPQ